MPTNTLSVIIVRVRRSMRKSCTKRRVLPQLVAFAIWCAPASLLATPQFNQLVNQMIPDGSPVGLARTLSVSGQSGTIGDVQVTLNISGSDNGDIYAYLEHGNGFAVLLNRVGATASDILGYSDPGLNVTFSDNAINGNIHTTGRLFSATQPSRYPGL